MRRILCIIFLTILLAHTVHLQANSISTDPNIDIILLKKVLDGKAPSEDLNKIQESLDNYKIAYLEMQDYYQSENVSLKDRIACDLYFENHKILFEEIHTRLEEASGLIQDKGDKYYLLNVRLEMLLQHSYLLNLAAKENSEGGTKSFGMKKIICIPNSEIRTRWKDSLQKKDSSLALVYSQLFGIRSQENIFYLSNFISQKSLKKAKKDVMIFYAQIGLALVPLISFEVGIASLTELGLSANLVNNIGKSIYWSNQAYTAYLGGSIGAKLFTKEEFFVREMENLNKEIKKILDQDLDSYDEFQDSIYAIEKNYQITNKNIITVLGPSYRCARQKCSEQLYSKEECNSKWPEYYLSGDDCS